MLSIVQPHQGPDGQRRELHDALVQAARGCQLSESGQEELKKAA